MRVQIRVINETARELAKVKKDLADLTNRQNRMGAAGRGASGFMRSGDLIRYGKDLQWTGRQIEYNFTLPIMAAGKAGWDMAMSQERAFTRLKKVYGDVGDVTTDFTKDFNLLRRAARALSDTFGVHQDEVLEIEAAWAAAGAQGYALAKATQTTLQAMVLGEMEHEQATKSLIAVQAAYRLNSNQLQLALAQLNAIENETAANLPDLIEGIVRAGGTAYTAGVQIKDLAAMIAALVETGTTGAVAGNSLKTVLSRLAAPTKDATDIMHAMGLEVDRTSWLTKTGTERLMTMAKAFDNLSDAQKQVASAYIAGRFQVSRFDALMQALLDSTSDYNKAQRATQSDTAVMTQMQKELNTALTSSPQAIKILQTRLMNMLTAAIIPLVPAIISVLTQITALVQKFTDLDPAIQKIIIGGFAFLALLGPLIRYVGAFMTLFGVGIRVFGTIGTLFGIFSKETTAAGKVLFHFRQGFLQTIVAMAKAPFTLISNAFSAVWAAMVFIATKGMGAIRMVMAFGWEAIVMYARGAGTAIVGAFTSPWVAIGLAVAAAIAAIIYIFRKPLGDAVNWVVDKFNQLPAGIRNAFIAVVRVVKAAVMAVYRLLSYLNPFARHSPSLVDQVNKGVDVIAAKYASLSDIGANFRRAIADMQAFKSATAGLMAGVEEREFQENRAAAVELDPSAGPAMDMLRASIKALEPDLERIAREYERQAAVVDQWEAELEAANRTLEAAEDHLDDLRDAASDASDALAAAKDELARLTRTPIQGMREMEDQIFANEMAQKRLRLEMLRWEDINGDLDDAKNKLAAIAGEVELLRGEQAALREAGAGGDVLGFYDDQIAGIEAQAKATEESLKPYNDMQAELERLQRQGEILDLENALKFDPLTRQIEQATNAMEEMPFDELLAKIQAQQGEVDRLTGVWEAAEAAVKQQEAVVDTLTASRDALQATYDAEKANLDELGAAYDAVERQIRDMEAAMGDFISAAQQAKDSGGSSLAMEQFDAAAGADIPDATVPAGIDDGDLEALVKEFEENAKRLFQGVDLTSWFKEKWHAAWAWVKENVGPVLEPIVGGVQDFFRGVGEVFDAFANSGPVKMITGVFESIFGGIAGFIRFAWPEIEGFFNALGGALDKAGQIIGGELKKWAPLWDQLVEAVTHVWNVIEPILNLMVDFIKVNLIPLALLVAAAWKVGWPILSAIIKPVFETIATIIRGALSIIRGILTVALALINGDWKAAWEGVKAIFSGVWDFIQAIFVGPFKTIVAIVKGVVEGIVNFFQWLYDVLIGHSIIPDLINGIIAIFQGFWDFVQMIWQTIADFIKLIWEGIKIEVEFVINAIKVIIETVFNVIKTIIETVLNIIKTIWETIWNAIKFVVETIWNFLKTFIDTEINGIRVIIETVTGVIRTVWDTVWNAVSNTVSTVWGVIKGVFQAIINFVNDHLMPIWNKLKDTILGAFNGVKDAMSGIWQAIIRVIKGAINIGIDILNKLIGGIETIANLIPGVNLNLGRIHPLGQTEGIDYRRTGPTTVEMMAAGGQVPNWFLRGMMNPYNLNKSGPMATAKPRAIVGEGSRTHPEFVIPTDPRFRNRAIGLFSKLASQLGIPGMAIGGIGIPGPLKDLGGALKAGWDATGGKVVSAVRKGAVMAAFAPVLKAVDALLGRIPWDAVRNVLNNVKNAVYNWAKGEDHGVNTELDRQERAAAAQAAAEAERQSNSGGSGWSYSGWGGRHAMGIEALPHAYRGAMIRGSARGTAIVAGDRNRDEAILPLPNGWEDGMGKTENNFYGELVFPNVKNGDDAEAFIRNLESLVD